jgi:hypothetical protein
MEKETLEPIRKEGVGSRTGLDDVEKRIFLTLPGLELRPLLSYSPYPVAIPTELSRLTVYELCW